ncbi:MAG: FMN-binding protein, partial [Eubacteriales bacterium]|nr:FMN-binding protein [Eubacteriales bacterium]
MGTIKKWLSSSGMAAIIFMAVIGFVLAMILSVFFARGSSSPVSEDVAGAYTPGTYTASADGFGGPVDVTVQIGSNGGITDVTITGDKETPDIGGAAIPVLKKAILTNQSADIDGVSGATFTSDAVKTAAAAALAQAGGAEVETGPKAEGGNLFIPGTYTETATGFGGEISVTTTVSESKIEDVKIEGDHETENIGTFAVEMLPERILAAQSPNVDALTGATVTSNAILSAFKKTLTDAGADLNAFPAAEDKSGVLKKYEELETDIVIIGAGGAGMTAAINATQQGKDVILL